MNYLAICKKHNVPVKIAYYLPDNLQQSNIDNQIFNNAIEYAIKNNSNEFLQDLLDFYPDLNDKKVYLNYLISHHIFKNKTKINLETLDLLFTHSEYLLYQQKTNIVVKEILLKNDIDNLCYQNNFSMLEKLKEYVDHKNIFSSPIYFWERALKASVDSKNYTLVKKVLMKGPHYKYSENYSIDGREKSTYIIDNLYNLTTQEYTTNQDVKIFTLLLDKFTIDMSEIKSLITSCTFRKNIQLLKAIFEHKKCDNIYPLSERKNDQIENSLKRVVLLSEDNDNLETLIILKTNGIYEEHSIYSTAMRYILQKKDMELEELAEKVGFSENFDKSNLIINSLRQYNFFALDLLMKNNDERKNHMYGVIILDILQSERRLNKEDCEKLIKRYVSEESLRTYIKSSTHSNNKEYYTKLLLEISLKDNMVVSKKAKL